MKRILVLGLAAIGFFLVPAAGAAKRQPPTNLESEEGEVLKQALVEDDAAKKTSLLEAFSAKYPAHEYTPWVLGELQAAYLKAGQFDKAMSAGEKILAADPDDLAIANANLKSAEGLKDPALIAKWASATSDAARRLVASKPPEADEEKAAWKAHVDYARQVDEYCDYAIYALAAQSTDAAKRVEFGELLAKRSPSSKYVGMLRPQMFLAYQQSGNHARALAIAEEVLKADPANDDMLIYAASQAYEKQDKAKAAVYAKQILAVLPAKAAPQGVAEADWTKNKNTKIGLADWMLGVIASNEQRWAEADTHLRAALPNVAYSTDLQAETLFHLGLANFKLGEPKSDSKRILDALKFNQQCAAIASSFQAQARKNVAAIRSQYRIR